MRLITLGVLCVLMSACWQQNEVVAIEKGGAMKWLVIATPDWDFVTVDGVKSDVADYTKQMTQAGWQVDSNTTIEVAKDVVLSLRGNLQKVSRTTAFYKIHSVTQSTVKIEFLCPMIDDEDRVSRFIKIKSRNASVISCSDGVQTFHY